MIQNQDFNLKRGIFSFVAAIFLLFSLCSLWPASQTHAWSEKKTSGYKKEKSLKKYHRKSITSKAVSRMLKQDFFVKDELPRKIVLAKLQLDGVGLGTTEIDYTNLVLNELLNYQKVFILNQDMLLDLSMNYKLMHYYPNLITRKKGIMLGANYYISGLLKSYPEVKKDGKIKRHYISSLVVRDIRTDEIMVSSRYDTKEKKKRKRRRR